MTDAPYQLVAYAKIDSLSTSVSGSNGGQTLVIQGSGFNAVDCSANVVVLQGVACMTQTCSQTQLTCIVGAAPSTPLGAGPYGTSRGLLHRVYWNLVGGYAMSNLLASPGYPNSPSITRLQGDGLQGYCLNCAVQYGQQLEGFFVPRSTGQYMFYVSADDIVDLYLSTTSSPANLTRVAYINSYTTSYWQYATQISAPITLQAGSKYFLRARMTQGPGSDSLNVAVRVLNPPARSASEVALHSVHSRQSIVITTAVRREVQRLNFTRASGLFMFYTSTFGPRSVQINISTTSTSTIAAAIAVSFIYSFILLYGIVFLLPFASNPAVCANDVHFNLPDWGCAADLPQCVPHHVRHHHRVPDGDSPPPNPG